MKLDKNHMWNFIKYLVKLYKNEKKIGSLENCIDLNENVIYSIFWKKLNISLKSSEKFKWNYWYNLENDKTIFYQWIKQWWKQKQKLKFLNDKLAYTSI